MFGEMFGQPPHRTAYLGNNAFEPRHRGKRVLDNREIDPERQQALGEEGEILLVVHLPIAAVDKRKRGRLRIGGEKQIEPLARSLAVSEVETSVVFAPHPGTACRPIGNNRVALRDRRRVVVGGIELGTVHSAVQHGAGSGRNSVEVGSHGSLPRVRRQPVEAHADHGGDQRRLIATAPVVTRYFASRLGLSRAGSDAGSARHARKRRVKAPKAASWPTRIASGIAIRHSDPRGSTAIPGWLDCNSVMRRCSAAPIFSSGRTYSSGRKRSAGPCRTASRQRVPR